MGQKLSIKGDDRRRNSLPAMLRFESPPPVPVITYRHLGINDSKLRIVSKDIPIPATKDGTEKKRLYWEYWTWIKSIFTQITAHPFFRNNQNTYDTLDDDHGEYELEITEQNWNRNIHSHMAVYALVINASNIFRFPYDCYRYGGGVFFLAYSFVSLFVVQPIIYLEMVVGQFSQTGVDGFGALHAFAKGIPQAIVFMSLIFVPYNSIVEGYTGKYVVGSFYSSIGNCQDSWNKLNSCVSYDEIQRFKAPPALKVKNIWLDTSTQRSSLLSTELYFRQFILHHRWDGSKHKDQGGWNPFLFIGLAVTYILVFISIRVRLTSLSSKILIILSCLIPLLLSILLASQVFRDGAVAGILELFFFQIRQLGNIFSLEFWCEVFRSSFLTSGIGCGLYSRIASKNPFNKDSLYRSSWMVIILMLCLSLVSSFILMAELGALKFIFSGSSYDTIFAEHTGSVFAAASGALLMFNSRIPIFIFFAACTICGIWSQVVATENCASQVVKWFSIATEKLQFARYIALVIVIGLQAGCATLVSKAGGVMLDSFLFDGTWAAAFVSLAEVISIAYIYGTVFFMIDIELMLRHSAPTLFKFQLRYSSPVALLIMLLAISYGNIRYGDEKYLGVIPIPDFVLIIGYVFNAVPPILILSLAGLGLFQKKKKGLFWVPATDYLQEVFTRFSHRRPGIFEPHHAHVRHTITADAIHKLKQIERALSLKTLRTQLEQVRACQKARANWLRLTNKILVSKGRFNSLSRVADWILREMELKRTRKEVKYLEKILRNYSMECIFTVPKQVHSLIHREREEHQLANILLNSLPLEELGFKYPKRTLYERLVGKTNPIPEEDKATLIVRIKRHLEIECSKDTKLWLRLLDKLEESRKKNTVFREDTPIEFYFRHALSQQLIRVIMFKGLDHSILFNSPLPRPHMVQVNQRHLRQRVGRSLWKYLTHIVTKEIEGKKGLTTLGRMKKDLIKNRRSGRWSRKGSTKGIEFDTDTSNSSSSSQVIPDTPSSTSSQLDTESVTTQDFPTPASPSPNWRRQLFTPLVNWYHNCDTRRYKIRAENTFFVVILDRAALKEMVKGRFALILPPDNPPRPREIVEFNKPGVYEATYADIRPFWQKIAQRGALLKKGIGKLPTVDLSRHSKINLTRGRPKSKPVVTSSPSHVTRIPTRRYSELDIHLLRRPATSSSLASQRRFSDSFIAEERKKEVGQTAAPADVPMNTTSTAGSIKSTRKSERTLAQVRSEDWKEDQLLKITERWQNPAFDLTRTNSDLYSEKAMAMWLSETKGKMKMKAKLNEDDGFFYRRKGKELLVIEPRKGRAQTSTSDTSIGTKLGTN